MRTALDEICARDAGRNARTGALCMLALHNVTIAPLVLNQRVYMMSVASTITSFIWLTFWSSRNVDCIIMSFPLVF